MKQFLTRNGIEIPMPCFFVYLKDDGMIHCSTHVMVGYNRFTHITCNLAPEEIPDFWHLFLHDPASCLESYFNHPCVYEEGPPKAPTPSVKAPAAQRQTFTLADLGLLKPTR